MNDNRWPARYGCNGPEGTFWTDDLALASRLIAAAFGPDDEWTVTDMHNPTLLPATPGMEREVGVWLKECSARGEKIKSLRDELTLTEKQLADAMRALADLQAEQQGAAVDLGKFRDPLNAAFARLQSIVSDESARWSEREKASNEQAALYPLLALIDSKAARS